MTRRPFVAGNWKMNVPVAPEAAIDMIASEVDSADPGTPGVVICPPATMISRLSGRGVRIGAQDCHAAASGAHTGDVSAAMVAAAGASHVILGHSERRAAYGETDEAIAAKVKSAWKAELTTIVCVGESAAQRKSGDAVAAVSAQLAASLPKGATAANAIVAYEPIWAIGSGEAATPAQIDEMHKALREAVEKRFGGEVAKVMRIVYGGSVTPANAAEIFALEDVDGGLIGGASLKPRDFLAVVKAA